MHADTQKSEDPPKPLIKECVQIIIWADKFGHQNAMLSKLTKIVENKPKIGWINVHGSEIHDKALSVLAQLAHHSTERYCEQPAPLAM